MTYFYLKTELVGQDCNCNWTKNPGACSNNDGSHCWRVCCNCDCTKWLIWGLCFKDSNPYCRDKCCGRAKG
jgi:hypothetical protein